MTVMAAQFLTVAREDLFALTHSLFAALPDSVLGDKDGPLVVDVLGTLACGKKIVTDAAREVLFDDGQTVMDGKTGYDEYWSGTRNGAPLEVDYIDMAYPLLAEYSPRIAGDAPLLRGRFPGYADNHDVGAKRDYFLAQRRHGGVTFLQNPETALSQGGLRIFIEKSMGTPLSYDSRRALNAPLSMRDAFNDMAHKNGWVRFVEVNVHDERLQNDGRFMAEFMRYAAFTRYEPPFRADKIIRPHRSDFDIFGRNFPHVL